MLGEFFLRDFFNVIAKVSPKPHRVTAFILRSIVGEVVMDDVLDGSALLDIAKPTLIIVESLGDHGLCLFVLHDLVIPIGD